MREKKSQWIVHILLQKGLRIIKEQFLKEKHEPQALFFYNSVYILQYVHNSKHI